VRFRLGRVLVNTDRFEEAEPLLRRAIADMDNGMRNRTISAVSARKSLADGLMNAHRLIEAEQVLLEAFDRVQQFQAVPLFDVPGHRREVIERLVKLYQLSDNPEKASYWNAELDKTKFAMDGKSKPD